MNFLPHKKVICSFILLLSALFFANAQDQNNKWIIGIGVNAVDFYPTGEPSEYTGNESGFFSQIVNAKDHWNVFLPSVHVTRHLKNRFSIDASITINSIKKIGNIEVDKLSYVAFDGNLQYNFLDSSHKISPYVAVGGGYTWIDSKGWGTVNAGIGSNVWFSDIFGAKVQALYKHSGDKNYDVLSHFQYSLSAIIKLNTGNGKFKCQ